jgi:hypothetical protein
LSDEEEEGKVVSIALTVQRKRILERTDDDPLKLALKVNDLLAQHAHVTSPVDMLVALELAHKTLETIFAGKYGHVNMQEILQQSWRKASSYNISWPKHAERKTVFDGRDPEAGPTDSGDPPQGPREGPEGELVPFRPRSDEDG